MCLRLLEVERVPALFLARSGNPNGGGLPQWPAYNETERQSLVLDLPSYIVGAELDVQNRTRWGDL